MAVQVSGAGRLDLDHLGAEISQCRTGRGSKYHGGHFDRSNALEQTWLGCHVHRLHHTSGSQCPSRLER